MKRTKFLKRKLLMILGFMAVFLHSCQNDDFKENNHNHQNKLNVKIEDKTFENLMNDQKFSSAFGKITKQKYKLPNSIVAKTVMEEDYDFIISDDIPAKVITTESLTSYTFHISRENDSLENSNSFENLIVLIDSLDTTTAYILKYNLLSEPIYYDEHDSYILNAETELIPITFNASNAKAISFLANDGCTVVTLMCPHNHPHPAGADCIAQDRGDLYWESDSSNCGDGGFSGSGNSGSTGTTPGNGNQNGGGGNNNEGTGSVSPIVTTPVGMDGRNQNSTSNDENNCITLNELTQTDSLSANIKPIVGDLREKVTLDKEWSACFKRSVAYSGDYAIQMDDVGITEGPSRTRSRLMYGWPYVGQIHTHPVGTYAMFSWLDLARLRDIYKDAPNIYTNTTDNQSHVFIMIVCHNGAVYSLKVDDYEKLNSKINNDLARAKSTSLNQEEKTREKEDYIEEGLEKYYRKNKNNLEKSFLQKYGNYGISLYKATDENLTSWEKLELDNPNSDNPVVVPKPCN
ncbi:MAG: hypothetical protein RBR78_10710 [Flavobacteriaceae bacterium]|jgi:hypothetical protein|nr:hypothetical protein [Flavobacteriaceae bacterium]